MQSSVLTKPSWCPASRCSGGHKQSAKITTYLLDWSGHFSEGDIQKTDWWSHTGGKRKPFTHVRWTEDLNVISYKPKLQKTWLNCPSALSMAVGRFFQNNQTTCLRTTNTSKEGTLVTKSTFQVWPGMSRRVKKWEDGVFGRWQGILSSNLFQISHPRDRQHCSWSAAVL